MDKGTFREPRVAIVSDTMVQAGGAERVVEALAEAFPEAPIYCVLYSPAHGPRALEGRIVQSWLHRLPGAEGYAKALLPLYPSAIEGFDLSEFDVIVSSHHTLAKGLMRTSAQKHVCYCHTPMRSLWERPHEEINRAPQLVRPLIRVLLSTLRTWDISTILRVDYFIANSRLTSERIAKHYRQESLVLYPPIDIVRFTPGDEEVADYYLVASRNVPYKRVDLAIEAAEHLERRLIVVGDGTDRAARASRFVTYLGKVSEAKLLSLMRGARALLFPQVEDFGMTVLEMNACGRPVIAYGAGGALETVIDGVTGIIFDEQSAAGLAGGIERFEMLDFDPQAIRRHAERFSKERFIERIRAIVEDIYHRRPAPPTPLRSAIRVSSVEG
jgi:glycosyltransferase involved in cell wall biosynthesis